MVRGGKYKKLFEEFKKLNVLIIGDVMVDSYLWGKVERISPEAPIPVVALKKRENRMGGAANVAMNIRSLGARPVLCSVIGTDEKGERFLELAKKERIPVAGILRSKDRLTTTKFRIFGNSFQMLRVDEEVDHNLRKADYQALAARISELLEKERINCIIFQDYDKGVITPDLISFVVKKAKEKGIPVTVDPKRKNFMAYHGVTLFKPNLKELKEGLKIEFDPTDTGALVDAANSLREILHCRYILTTLSEHGMMISMDEGRKARELFIPAHIRSVSDVSGAGDTVISVASLCLAMKCTPYEVAYLSNLAGGLVCEEVGVVPVNRDRLLKEVQELL